MPYYSLQDPRIKRCAEEMGVNRTDARRIFIKEDLTTAAEKATSLEDMRFILKRLIESVHYV